MADVFISYARSTAQEAQRIAEALRALGYNVWRDDELPAHRSYAEVIEERLKAAKAVVVIWSAEAVKSEWVRSEADRARNDRKLVQLTLDSATLPMPFDQIQCADLSGWSGDLAAPGWRKIVASIGDLVGAAARAATPLAREPRKGISICVLPFANMSDDAQQEYFADGISEDIITDLSKVSALSVIARNSAFTFKGKYVDIKGVARQLDVSHVLEGSVRKSGSRLRITAQLIDGASNNHVWAERYDRNLDDIFALQDEISEAIVAALKLKLLPEEKKAIEDRGTTNAEAYDILLRARSLTSQFGASKLKRSIELYRQALVLDSNFLDAWSGLTTALINYANFAGEHRAEILSERDEALERIIALTPDELRRLNAQALRLVLRRDYLGADELLQQVRSRSVPTSLAVISIIDRAFIAFDDGVAHFRSAVEGFRDLARQDPLSLLFSMILQECLDIVGRPDEAQAEYERSRDLPGDRELVEFFAFLRLWNRIKPNEAAAQYDRVLACRGTFFARPVFIQLASALRDRSTACNLIRGAMEDPARQEDPEWSVHLSLLAGMFGETGLALAGLRHTYVDIGYFPARHMWMPALAEARKDPRFKQLVRDLGLHDYWKKSGKWGDFARPLGDDDFEIVR